MGLIGACLGDIAGSKFEFAPMNFNRKEHTYELFNEENYYTDDTVLSIACKEAILHKDLFGRINFAKAYDRWGNKYPNAGYGGSFVQWLETKDKKPYGSFGNGAAMRCSYCGEIARSFEECDKLARHSAECTHNHFEGIKGAITLARCVYMAGHNASKEEILTYGIDQYPLMTKGNGHSYHGMTGNGYVFSPAIPTDTYMDTINYEISCQGCVPVAIRCFYDTESFEECMYLINSMNIDTDTVGAIAGAICHSYYGDCTGSPESDKEILERYLSEDMLEVIYK